MPKHLVQKSEYFLHKGVIWHAWPGHKTEGSIRNNSDGGEVAERESENHCQAPDTDDGSNGGLS